MRGRLLEAGSGRAAQAGPPTGGGRKNPVFCAVRSGNRDSSSRVGRVSGTAIRAGGCPVASRGIDGPAAGVRPTGSTGPSTMNRIGPGPALPGGRASDARDVQAFVDALLAP